MLSIDGARAQAKFATTAYVYVSRWWPLRPRRLLYAILNRFDVEEDMMAKCLAALFDRCGCDVHDLSDMLMCLAGRTGKHTWLDVKAPKNKRNPPLERRTFQDCPIGTAMAPWIALCPDAWLFWTILNPRPVWCWDTFAARFGDVLLTDQQSTSLSSRLEQAITWAAANPRVAEHYVQKKAFLTQRQLRMTWIRACVSVS